MATPRENKGIRESRGWTRLIDSASDVVRRIRSTWNKRRRVEMVRMVLSLYGLGNWLESTGRWADGG